MVSVVGERERRLERVSKMRCGNSRLLELVLKPCCFGSNEGQKLTYRSRPCSAFQTSFVVVDFLLF